MIKLFFSDPINKLYLIVLGVDISISIIWFCIVLMLIKIEEIILKLAKSKASFEESMKLYELVDKLRFGKLINFYEKFVSISNTLVTLITCLYSIKLIYTIVNLSISIIGMQFKQSENITSYLSLTIVLIGIAYYPEKIIFTVQSGINKVLFKTFEKEEIEKMNDDLVFYKKVILLLRPKLWMYFISIFITILSSVEKISGCQIVTYQSWLQIKPIITESVLTVIVVDRFINLFKSEYDSIKKETRELVDTKNKTDSNDISTNIS